MIFIVKGLEFRFQTLVFFDYSAQKFVFLVEKL